MPIVKGGEATRMEVCVFIDVISFYVALEVSEIALLLFMQYVYFAHYAWNVTPFSNLEGVHFQFSALDYSSYYFCSMESYCMENGIP